MKLTYFDNIARGKSDKNFRGNPSNSILRIPYLMVVFFLNLNQFGNGLFCLIFLASISFFLMDLEDYNYELEYLIPRLF